MLDLYELGTGSETPVGSDAEETGQLVNFTAALIRSEFLRICRDIPSIVSELNSIIFCQDARNLYSLEDPLSETPAQKAPGKTRETVEGSDEHGFQEENMPVLLNKKADRMLKITLIISGLVMVICYCAAVLKGSYDYPILIGTISGIMFLCCDLLVFIKAIWKIKMEDKNDVSHQRHDKK